MKRIIRLFLCCSICFNTVALKAQDGPGGIGEEANISFWLDANNLSLSNGDAVSTWADTSVNQNDATQATGSNQPTFNTNAINGRPSISFDGTNDVLNFGTNVTSDELSSFIIYKNTFASSIGSVLQLSKHNFAAFSGTFRGQYVGNVYTVNKTFNTFSVASCNTTDLVGADNLVITSGSNANTFTRTSFRNSSTSTIGSFSSAKFQGEISEILTYSTFLPVAKRRIVNEFLAAKYNLDSEAGLYLFRTTYGTNVKGIGKESDGENTSCRAYDSVLVSGASSLDDGDYMLFGHNNLGYGTSASVGSGTVERWEQVWRVDKTNSPGTVSVEIFLGANGFSAITDYVLLIETVDGDFSNGGVSSHETGRTYNASNNSITFTNVDFPDDCYFTLGEKESEFSSIASGDWSNTATWSCTCIPGENDIATITTGHTVTVSSDQSIFELTVDGTLSFSGSDTLHVNNTLVIAGSLVDGDGTLASEGNSGSPAFTNSTGALLELNNLYVNNTNGLSLMTSGWSIEGSLRVTAGGLDVTSADSVVLVSNASQTSEILESMDDAFTGDFIIQRHIGARNANYANISIPIETATVAQLDDDLFLSGVSGNNGNALMGNGEIFRSLWVHYPWLGLDDSLTSTADVLSPGIGYELYLADNTTTYGGGTIDYEGVPNSGDQLPRNVVQKGWNLLGNPYHAHIAYDSIQKDVHIPDEYYIFNTDNGSYDLFTGTNKPLIASGQGFWIFKEFGTAKFFDFKEDDKATSTSSAFLRTKSNNPFFSLNLSNNVNTYNHSLKIRLNTSSTSDIDEQDSYFLSSPLSEVPAITSRANNSTKKLALNSLNNLEDSHVIPIDIYSGVDAEYEITSENLDALTESYSCIYLKDKLTDKVIDLVVEQSYKFDSQEGNSNRFELIMSNYYDDCDKLLVNSNTTVQDLTTKLNLRSAFENVYIDYTFADLEQNLEIQVFNINGQKVLETVNISVSGAGSYQLRNLSGLKGIYLIQVKSSEQFFNKTIKL